MVGRINLHIPSHHHTRIPARDLFHLFVCSHARARAQYVRACWIDRSSTFPTFGLLPSVSSCGISGDTYPYYVRVVWRILVYYLHLVYFPLRPAHIVDCFRFLLPSVPLLNLAFSAVDNTYYDLYYICFACSIMSAFFASCCWQTKASKVSA